MSGKIFISFLCVIAMTTKVTIASPFLDGAVPQKNESGPSAPAVAPKIQLPPMPLPKFPALPLPKLPVQKSPDQGQVIEFPTKRWVFVGRIDNQVFVTDTQSGEMVSFPEGASLAGGCVATYSGVICGKDATERKAAPRVESRKASDAYKLDELIFSARDIAQKCIQLDDTFKSEILKNGSLQSERENELKMLKTDLEIRKLGQEQLVMEQKALQEQLRINGTLKERDAEIKLLSIDLEIRKLNQEQLLLEQQVLKEQLVLSRQLLKKTEMEHTKIKDENAFLITSIAVLERVKGLRFKLPKPGDSSIRGLDGSTFTLDLKKNSGPTAAEPARPGVSPGKNMDVK